MIILSDHAGTGKSSAFKDISVRLNNKYSDHFVSFIELKKHLKIYQKFLSNFTQINTKEKIIEILKEILNLTDNLESAVFVSLFNSNKVILFLDGFDEICPNFKEFFVNFIQMLRNLTENQIWISTRPQHMKELKQKFKQRPFKLLPFDKNEKIKCLNFFNENSSNDEILKFSKNYLKNFDNPQMLKILAEINAKSPINSMSLLKVVEKVVENYKNYLVAKHNEIANLERDPNGKLNIWQVLQINALKLTFKEHFEDFLAPKSLIKLSEFSLFKKYQNVKHKWTPEAISRYGFLYFDNWGLIYECPNFIHNIFEHFFVAKFLIENIFEADDDDVSYEYITMRMKMLIYVVEREKGDMKIVMGFLKDYFEEKLKEAELNR